MTKIAPLREIAEFLTDEELAVMVEDLGVTDEDRIWALRAINKNLQKHLEACSDTCGFQARQIERLRAALRLIADPGDVTTAEELGYIAHAALEGDEK